MTLVTLPYRPQDGDPEDVSQIVADLDAILAVLNGDVRDDNVSSAAAIDYAKLALTGQVRNSDVAAAAAIAVSKLAPGTEGYVLKIVGGVPVWTKANKLLTNMVPAGTGANTAETNLQSVVIPAAELAAGDMVRIGAAGTFTGSAGNRTARVYFGASSFSFTSASASAAIDWQFEVLVGVTGAATEYMAAHFRLFTAAALDGESSQNLAPAEAISGAITVKTTGITPSAGDEVTSSLLTVEIIHP